MWNNKKVSLIFPTYNEKDSIKDAIIDFEKVGFLDEIIVVNNNAKEGTSEEVLKAHSSITREVLETKQGYGNAIRRGIDESTGDLIIISEPDGTFFGKDIHKLLAYSEEFDVVYGSRTAKELIWKGANMGAFLRWGNWAVAKLMEFLFNTTNLTDVGCTMRLIHKKPAEILQKQYTVGREHFGPEMMMLSFINKFKSIQIPVNYTERIGESSVTGDFKKAFKLGIIMIWLIIKYRVNYLGKIHFPYVKDILKKYDKPWIIFVIALLHFLFFYSLIYIRYKSYIPIMDYHAYTQMLWNTSNGDILAYSQNRNNQASFFSLHFAPFLMLLSPIYSLIPHPMTLYFVFMLFTSLSVIPLFFMAKDVLKRTSFAYLVVAIYILYPPFIQSFMQGFCEEAFATSLIMFALYFMHKRKSFLFVVFSILVLSLRINMVLPIFMLGLYSFFFKKMRGEGLFLSLLSIGWLIFIMKVIQPIYTPAGTKPYIYGFFDAYGENLQEIVTNFFMKPNITFHILFNRNKVTYLKDLLGPFFYLPIISVPTFLISLPTLMLNLLSSNARLSTVTAYYHSSITPIIFYSFLYSLRIIKNNLEKIKAIKISTISILAILCLSLINVIYINKVSSVGSFTPFTSHFNPQYFSFGARDEQIDKIVNNIPPRFALGVTDSLFEHIAERKWYFNASSYTGYIPDLIIYDPWRDKDFAAEIQKQSDWVLLFEESFYQFLVRQDLLNTIKIDAAGEWIGLLDSYPKDFKYLAYLETEMGQKSVVPLNEILLGKSLTIENNSMISQEFIADNSSLSLLEIPVTKSPVKYDHVWSKLVGYVFKPKGNLNVKILDKNNSLLVNQNFSFSDISLKKDVVYVDISDAKFEAGGKYFIQISLDNYKEKNLFGIENKLYKYKVYTSYLTDDEKSINELTPPLGVGEIDSKYIKYIKEGKERNDAGETYLVHRLYYGERLKVLESTKEGNYLIYDDMNTIKEQIRLLNKKFPNYNILNIVGTQRISL